MAKSRDPKELAAIWEGWHKVGAPMRDRLRALRRTLESGRAGTRLCRYRRPLALGYDMTPEQFSAELERLWKQVEPLYLELHAYVRRS